MPDIQKLIILSQLREQRNLNLEQMAFYCGLNSRKGRESVSKWELGLARPRPSRRAGFLNYLCKGLQLDRTRLLEVWAVIEESWQWSPLSAAELADCFPAETKADLALNSPPPSLSEETDFNRVEQRNRTILLNRVCSYWIKGVLEQSLHQGILLELGLQKRPEAVVHPWELILQRSETKDRRLPAGIPVIEIFEEMGQSLLILGESGSGKTTLLLELARDAIGWAEKDVTYPIPVVFNLSSWPGGGQSIADWLLEELNSKYFIPKPMAWQWVEHNELLLLLDGLDEVVPEQRESCLEALNQFRQTYLMPVVVCSRTGDYQALKGRLALGGAVLIEPLADPQIEAYFMALGETGQQIRALWVQDEALQELAHSPLMLNIITLAYQEKGETVFQPGDLEDRRQQVYEAYVARMFKRRKGSTTYTPPQTVQWLSWLGSKLKEQSQTVFLIEHLQPGWLSDHRQRWAYILFSRLLMGLLMGGILGLANILSTRRGGVLIGLLIALSVTVSVTVGVGGIGILRLEVTKGWGLPAISHRWRNLVRGTTTGLITMACTSLLVMANYAYFNNMYRGIRYSLAVGVITALFFGFRESTRELKHDIYAAESFGFAWKKAVKGVLWGLGVGLIAGYMVARGSDSGAEISPVVFRNTLAIGLIGSIISGAFSGLSHKTIVTTTFPNQGIILFGKAMMVTGLGFGAIGMLAGTWMSTHNGALTFGLLVGGLAVMWAGGLDVVQHYTLRSILIASGAIPWSYVHFLDYATERVFLNRVGGGYVFIHRTLLEYFATLTRKQDVYPKRLGLRLTVALLSFVVGLGIGGYILDLPGRIKADAYSLQGDHYSRSGDWALAFEAYTRAVEADPNNPWRQNDLCWVGSLTDHPAEVKASCEAAVQKLPNEWWVYDSRGLARVLLGDYEGASEDFRFVVAELTRIGYDSAIQLEREAWLEMLEAGRNPITSTVLDHLRQTTLPLDHNN